MAHTCSILQEVSDWPIWILIIKAMSLDVGQYIDPNLLIEPLLPSFQLKPPVPSQISPIPDGMEIKNVNFDLHLKAYAVQYILYKDKRKQVDKIREKVASVHTYILAHIAPVPFKVEEGGSAYRLLKSLKTQHDALKGEMDARMA